MASVINTNIAATRTHNVYNRNNEFMNAAMNRVATGMKINSAKDNASTWAISEKMRERIRANDQANQNVQNDTALLKTAQGGIGNTIDILNTLKERAINAANDSNMNVDRVAIATEVFQLVSQIDDNAEKIKFNGRQLINGNYEDSSIETTFTAKDEVTAGTIAKANEAANTPKTTVTDTDDDYTGNATVTGDYKGVSTDGLNDSEITKASHAVLSLADMFASATAAGTKISDLKDSGGTNGFGIAAGDSIKFTWGDGGSSETFTYTLSAGTETIGALATAFNADSNVSAAGFYMSFVDPSTSSDIPFSTTATDLVTQGGSEDKLAAATKGYYITSKNDISNFKITATIAASSPAADFNANAEDKLSAVAAKYRADGVSDSSAAVEGTRSVLGTAAGAFQTYDSTAQEYSDVTDGSTKLTDLKYDNNGTATAVFSANNVIKFSWLEKDDDGNNVEKSASYTVTASSTLDDLAKDFSANEDAAAAGLRLRYFAEGDDITRGSTTVQDNDGNDITAANSGFYMTGADGKNINGLIVSVATSSSNSTAVEAAESALTFDTRVKYAEPAKETIDTSPALQFYVGGEANFGINVSFGKMTSDALLYSTDDAGTKTTYTVKEFSELFLDKEGAEKAIGIIDTALSTAMREQTKLGAIENRLGYTSDNLTTMNENLEAADSAFRDADIAKEMTSYMKYAVLSQASQYMLAQAGQNAFQVLNLLQQ